MRRLTTLLATVVAGMIGCLTGSCQNTFQSLDNASFSQLLEKGDVQLVDVRTPEEFAQGHIPEAVNIDVSAADFMDRCTGELDKDRTVAVYCRSGRRSKTAAKALSKAGFKVVELDGGYISWDGPKTGTH